MTTYKHSIIMIQNTFDPYPNKYLTYYDSRWNCDFFINYKTVDNMEEYIRDRISRDFKIEASNIQVALKGNAIQRKYSVSHQKNKVYNHSYYFVTISEFNDGMKQDSFELDSIQYSWLSINEMKKNKNTVSKNLDVIHKVEEIL